MPRYPRSHSPAEPRQGAMSPNREPAGGRSDAEYHANAVGKGSWRDQTPQPPSGARSGSSGRSARSVASSTAGRDGNGVPITTIRSHQSALSRMPTLGRDDYRPQVQSARLASVTPGRSPTTQVNFTMDSAEALDAAKSEILLLRSQLGLPPETPTLQPPVALGHHMPESPGGFTPEPGMPRTTGSAASHAVSLPGSPRSAEPTAPGSAHHYGSNPLPPPTGRSELTTANSTDSAWSEQSALIRANFKPTQQLFRQRFNTPREILTRGGRTRIVAPRNVTRYELRELLSLSLSLLSFSRTILWIRLRSALSWHTSNSHMLLLWLQRDELRSERRRSVPWEGCHFPALGPRLQAVRRLNRVAARPLARSERLGLAGSGTHNNCT